MYYSKDIQKTLDFILNKAFCHHTFQKAVIAFNKILPALLPEDRYCIKEHMLELDPTYTDGAVGGEERGYYGAELAEAIKSIKNRKSADDDSVKKCSWNAIWAKSDDGRYPVSPENDYIMVYQ